MSVLSVLFGNYSKRELKRIQPICDAVLKLEDKYKAMSDSELQAQTSLLKERLSNGETLDDILPDAFAACREASDRVLGMRHFPVAFMWLRSTTIWPSVTRSKWERFSASWV